MLYVRRVMTVLVLLCVFAFMVEVKLQCTSKYCDVTHSTDYKTMPDASQLLIHLAHTQRDLVGQLETRSIAGQFCHFI